MARRRHPLEKVLGHTFADASLLEEALTHRGALGLKGAKAKVVANERLEFLGDRVLGLVIAEALLKAFPAENEGSLAPRLAALVSAPTLAKVAEELELAAHVKVAPGQSIDGAESAVLADACEALIGAIYADGGLEVARSFVLARWMALVHADALPPKDAKTTLQEWAQGRGLPLPAYRTIKESGPAHAPSFIMAVKVGDNAETQGEGRTKRLATQAAAAALLAQLAGDSP